jgi:hypothetical protein
MPREGGARGQPHLKVYRLVPTKQRKAALRARFDRIFMRKTGFVTLDRLLARLNVNKPELFGVSPACRPVCRLRAAVSV